MQPKKFHTSKKQVILRINVSKISLLSLTQNFSEALEREISAVQIGNSTSEKCEIPQDIIHCTTLAIFGKITSKGKTSSAMTPVIEDKRTALAEYKRSPNQRNLQTLRAAISKAQKTARHGYRLLTRTQRYHPIQVAALSGSIKAMYNGIKRTVEPAQNKTAPLKPSTGEVFSDKNKQMERWIEQYTDCAKHNYCHSP